MRWMRRVVLTGVATAILIAVPQSAWASMLFSNAFWSSYAQISASGTGALTQQGKGSAHGTVWGTASVQGDVKVTGWATRKWNAARTVETFVGKPGQVMYVSTWGQAWWKFVLKGTSSISGSVKGSASAIGTGKYSVNGHQHAWWLYSPFRISTW